MHYEDTITLMKQGGSRILVIPAKWLRENKCEDFGYKVKIVIDLERIQLYPLRSEWEKRHPSIIGGKLMEIPDATTEEAKPMDKSMEAPEDLPSLIR